MPQGQIRTTYSQVLKSPSSCLLPCSDLLWVCTMVLRPLCLGEKTKMVNINDFFLYSFFPSFFKNPKVRISCMGRIGIYSYNTWQCSKILGYDNYCATVYFHFIPFGKYIIQVRKSAGQCSYMENIECMKTLLCNELHTEWYGQQCEMEAKFPGLIGDTVLPNECLSRTPLLA